MELMEFQLSDLARQYGEMPAIVTDRETVTFREYGHLVRQARDRLLQNGIKGGMRVALGTVGSRGGGGAGESAFSA